VSIIVARFGRDDGVTDVAVAEMGWDGMVRSKDKSRNNLPRARDAIARDRAPSPPGQPRLPGSPYTLDSFVL
jgi:hypothetical protein